MDALRYDPVSKVFGLFPNTKVPSAADLAEDELIVEVKCAGLCGTDLHIMEVKRRRLSVC